MRFYIVTFSFYIQKLSGIMGNGDPLKKGLSDWPLFTFYGHTPHPNMAKQGQTTSTSPTCQKAVDVGKYW